MNVPVATRPQRIAEIEAAMAELDRACGTMRGALRESNDERHHAFFTPVLDRLIAIIANERDGITLELATDLANIRSAVRRLRLPDIDQDLDGPTPALAALRASRSNLVESIDNALDAAAELRLHPRHSELGGIFVERRDVGEQLIRLDERLRAVQHAVGGLRGAAAAADAAPGTGLPSQTALVHVHVRTLTVETSSARFETATGESAPPKVDMAALTRAVAAMHEMTGDLKQAIEGLSGMMSEVVRAVGMIVVRSVERAWRGLKTVVSAVRRKAGAGGLARGHRFRDFPAAPEMIVVPPGKCLMGSAEGEGENRERPRHEVTIEYPLAVGVCPVTRGEFAAFVAATNYKIEYDPNNAWQNPGYEQTDNHPVVCMSWHDAQAYVAWLRERSCKAYRLLSEAEWEFCCRAGTATTYSTGDSIMPRQANFDNNEKGTTAVKRYSANPWGFHDMHGNVWEWCEDFWHPHYKGMPPTDGSAWKGKEEDSRVLRGGSWFNSPDFLRSAFRIRGHLDYRDYCIGFRVARTL